VIFLLVTTTFKQQAALKLHAARIVAGQKGRRERKSAVRREHRHNGVYYRGKLPVTFEQLQANCGRRAKKSDLVLAINADENAPWGKVVKVRDAAAEAKIKTLVAFTKETANRHGVPPKITSAILPRSAPR
jgi:biopolymer transport protein ExbD